MNFATMNILVTLAVSFSFTTGCRTTGQVTSAGASTATIKVTMLNMQAADKGRPDFRYEMLGCGQSSSSGILGTDGILSFTTIGISRGDHCQLRVSGPSNAPGIIFFADHGVFYEADKMAIIDDGTGQLVGRALLQTMYAPKTDRQGSANVFTAVAPFSTPTNMSGLCTCQLKCGATIPTMTSSADQTTGTSGSCTFTNKVDPSLTTLSCTRLMVQCGGDVWLADYPTPVVVDPNGGKTTTFSPISLSAAIVPTTSTDVTIDIAFPSKN